MAFGALATMVLIGLDAQGSSMFAALVLGAGALTAFFAGCMIFAHTSADLAETARFDEMADDVEDEAHIHLLENRETELVRQVATSSRAATRSWPSSRPCTAARGPRSQGGPRPRT